MPSRARRASGKSVHRPGEPPGNKSLLERRGNGKDKISKTVCLESNLEAMMVDILVDIICMEDIK